MFFIHDNFFPEVVLKEKKSIQQVSFDFYSLLNTHEMCFQCIKITVDSSKGLGEIKENLIIHIVINLHIDER